MFIIKRYPKQDGENRQYKYLFYYAGITDEVADSLKEILSTYIGSLSKLETESIPRYHPDLEETPCYVELSPIDFPYWSYFTEALRLDYEVERTPKNIESNLWGYLFFLRGSQYAIGYAKRLSKSKVVKKRFLKGGLVHRGTVLNSIEETGDDGLILAFNAIETVEGIEFDNSADFVFIVRFDERDPNRAESSWGVIWNKGGFESLLDVYEHQKQKALEVLEQCNMLQSVLADEDLQNFKQVVESNRQLYKMLLHPVTRQYMNEATIEDFKWVKEKFGEEVSFDIDETANRVILPPTNSKEYKKAVREILGVIGARFTKTLNNKHISKGKPEELR
ncbi:hypothetical protein A3L11_01985 [Thermococcus siculi]|uniref:DUF4868 domain-containing protein n=2 Tax=Thermococcus siculi TaxID=72803 RepID=A0A2Z2MI55_9EURY|nr:hypothetical protein A3L11_01985 [Thermococcus siculi]